MVLRKNGVSKRAVTFASGGLFAAMGLIAASCGSSSKNDKDEAKAEPTPINGAKTEVGTSLANELAAAYPVGLNLTSVTAVSMGATNLESPVKPAPAVDTAEGVVEEQTEEQSAKDKAKDAIAVIDGADAAACRPTIVVKRLKSPDCYAGNVEVADAVATKGASRAGTAVDNITFPTDLKPVGPTGKRGLRYGDSGVIHPTQGDNACLAATASFYVDGTAETVERATSLVAKALCAAKVAKKDVLPTRGKSVELTGVVNKIWNLPKSIIVQKAAITRVDVGSKDDSAPIFRTVLKVKFKAPRPRLLPGQGGEATEPVANLNAPGMAPASFEDRVLVIDLINNPLSAKEGDRKYKGRLSIFESGRTRAEPGSNKPRKQVHGVVVGYSRDGETIRTRFQSADFNVGNAVANHPARFIKKATGFFGFDDIAAKQTSAGDARAHDKRVIDNAVAGGFEMNLAEGTGKLIYNWQASLGDKAARTFAVEVKKNDAGKLEGCGLAGYSGSFAGGDRGKLQGFYCAWAQQDAAGTFLDAAIEPSVQKQCFTKSDDGKSWTLDPARNFIKYTVAQSCGKGDASAFDLVAVKSDASGELADGVAAPAADEASTNVAIEADADTASEASAQ